MSTSEKTIINLYAGPGVGKSTVQAGLFFHIKQLGYTAEMVREAAKWWCWEGRKITTHDQLGFLNEQMRKERMLIENDVEFIICDSPVFISAFYTQKNDSFGLERDFGCTLRLIQEQHKFYELYGYKTKNYVLTRSKPFVQKGRIHTEQESRVIDKELTEFLVKNNVVFEALHDRNSDMVGSIIWRCFRLRYF